MTDQGGPLHDVMSELSAGLYNSLRTSAALQHALTTGEFREGRVMQALRRHLPTRFALSTGVVVNAVGDVSRQQDVVITDPAVSSPFLSEGLIGLHPVETVCGLIEVKTAATHDAVRDGVEKIASVKRLLPDAPRPISALRSGALSFGETSEKPFGGIVAFSREGNRESLHATYVEACQGLSAPNRPNALLVIEDFVALWATGDPGALQLVPSALGASVNYLAPIGRNALLLFYVALMKALDSHQPPSLDLMDYVNAAGGVGPHEGTGIPVSD